MTHHYLEDNDPLSRHGPPLPFPGSTLRPQPTAIEALRAEVAELRERLERLEAAQPADNEYLAKLSG